MVCSTIIWVWVEQRRSAVSHEPLPVLACSARPEKIGTSTQQSLLTSVPIICEAHCYCIFREKPWLFQACRLEQDIVTMTQLPAHWKLDLQGRQENGLAIRLSSNNENCTSQTRVSYMLAVLHPKILPYFDPRE